MTRKMKQKEIDAAQRKWASDLKAATQYQQAIAGNESYCCWPTYTHEKTDS